MRITQLSMLLVVALALAITPSALAQADGGDGGGTGDDQGSGGETDGVGDTGGDAGGDATDGAGDGDAGGSDGDAGDAGDGTGDGTGDDAGGGGNGGGTAFESDPFLQERIEGEVLGGEGFSPEGGDAVRAYFEGEALSEAQVGDDGRFSILLIGDNTATLTVNEGPVRGANISFRYFDQSQNTERTDVQVETPTGEPFNFTFQGEEVVSVPFLPFDLTPTRNFNLRVGVEGAGGSGSGEPAGNFDVDGNGVVNTKDAAMVLRIVTTGGTGVDEDTRARADVDGNGAINTQDAIGVLQNR
ncbi:MAG: dockerin type I repeat-containing protein [Planctomycetota bacterium]